MDQTEKQKDREPLNIVILGASFAGLAVAHKVLRNTLEEIGVTRSAPRYRVVLIGPSTCLFWNIGAPRALVSNKCLPLDKVFVPFLPHFEEYPKTRFEYVQGIATKVEFDSRTVIVEEVEKSKKDAPLSQNTGNIEKQAQEVKTQKIVKFHALVIATGTSAESKLLSLHGPHENTVRDLQAFHDRVANANSIVVAGGGPSGIECAGQLATWLNRGKKAIPAPKTAANDIATANGSQPITILQRLLPTRRGKVQTDSEGKILKPPSRKTIILISGHDRLLPRLRPEFGAQAEAKLKKLGVSVIHKFRVERAIETPSGAVHCMLNGDDVQLTCDVFVGATGLYPNTSFMPPEMLTASGYVDADPSTLKVPNVPRVFAVGDCASHSKNSIQDVYDSLPILLHNLQNDLITYEYQTEHPYGGQGAELRLQKLEDWAYMQNPTDSQLMPISRFGGVGILFGMKLPSIMVWLMKGRDYRIGRAKLAAGLGKDPYATI
jgi:NADH dehydrogenase FAD-containing subunit